MSARKPYVRPMPASWWRQKAPYRLYMLREATVLPLTFFCLCLLAGVWSLGQGAESWAGWQAFMASPVVLVLNGLALVASLFHAATFFLMMPRVMPVKVAGKPLPVIKVALAQWAITAGISLFALLWLVEVI
ncbi:fumarate reductase subunit FrdC [Oceanimonas sp. CHS3-5]|uniref:fumarate reductase subunit FrdC n=1 Tax=Oceanimonas sp. CHS3-5 TaxID=3068186 RepID=UPI00273EF348|nr:fumarate reductase subunit FrdC [Oceanimonas sp. CHS3-5]MDP5292545.1 fumarate reductase subunit FrdC [Oceanimonas sp. CHS3-5]